MCRDRFKTLLGMLHISDPTQDFAHLADKIHKVRPLLDYVKKNAWNYFRPTYMFLWMSEWLSRKADLVFIKDKPVRFGFWVLAMRR